MREKEGIGDYINKVFVSIAGLISVHSQRQVLRLIDCWSFDTSHIFITYHAPWHYSLAVQGSQNEWTPAIAQG